jgi:hypothetical protein
LGPLLLALLLVGLEPLLALLLRLLALLLMLLLLGLLLPLALVPLLLLFLLAGGLALLALLALLLPLLLLGLLTLLLLLLPLLALLLLGLLLLLALLLLLLALALFLFLALLLRPDESGRTRQRSRAEAPRQDGPSKHSKFHEGLRRMVRCSRLRTARNAPIASTRGVGGDSLLLIADQSLALPASGAGAASTGGRVLR